MEWNRQPKLNRSAVFRDQGWGWGWAVLLVLVAGCEDPAVRCARVANETLLARYDRLHEERFVERLFAALPPDYTQDQYRSTRRRLRAQDAESLRAGILARTPGDSVRLRPDPVADSADLEVTPPPRPSDLAWEAEHCYQGKPR